MNVVAGTMIGPYRVGAPLGKGGMGEVWRAHDSRLGRDVAIKVLPPEFASDRDRLARFEREAKVLASLSHTNIAAIYGLEESGAARFLVLELVEGETLAQRLTRGPIPVAEALPLAIQIADAIDTAHEKDVIHRDLKPSNIKLTPDGQVKVLDFGLAKAMRGDAIEQNVYDSPTFSLAATAQGLILGTAAYMSPEQARGQAVDERTDVWAFGCVLYEMLVGRPAFRGDHVSDILASVLAREPDFSEIPATVPPRLLDVVRRCLVKNPKQRWQAIGDLRVELEQIQAHPVVASAAAPAETSRRRFVGMIPYVATAAIVAAAAAWVLKPAPARETPLIARFAVDVPASQPFRALGSSVVAVSPDGRYIAYNVLGGVYLRSMDTLTSRLIPGSELPLTNLFFSPNGNWLAFWSATTGTLQKISVNGGTPLVIAPSGPVGPFGCSWGVDDNILCAKADGIWRVSANGGSPQRIIPIDGSEVVDAPSLLPDGKTILYSVSRVKGANRWDLADIVVQVPNGPRQVLVTGGSDAVYVPTGHLVYAVGNVLYAIAFDAARLRTSGSPVPIVTGVQRAIAPDVNSASANYGVSSRGTLVYLNGTARAGTQQSILGVVDRNGSIRMLDVPKAQYRNPRVSPDGRQVAVESVGEDDEHGAAIWVYDLSGTSAIRRLTQDANSARPVWTPDGKRIAFGSDREKAYGIYWEPSDGSGLPERLTTAEDGYVEFPESFSPDGRVLSLAKVKTPLGQSSWGLYTLRLDSGDRTPQVFYDLPNSNEFGSQFSPDGKWIAYASNGSADRGADPTALRGFAIYVQPYPPTGAKYQITQTGGAWPVWSSNGRELLYRLQGNNGTPKIYSVSITTAPTPMFTEAHALPIQGFQPVINYREYDALPNGRGLVMVLPAGSSATGAAPDAHIDVVLNWFDELKSRIPTK